MLKTLQDTLSIMHKYEIILDSIVRSHVVILSPIVIVRSRRKKLDVLLSSSKNDYYSYGGAGVVLVYENRKSKFSVAYNNHILGDFDSSFNISGNNNNGIDILREAEKCASCFLVLYAYHGHS